MRQIFYKTPHLTFTVYRLLTDRLLRWREPILTSYPFRGFLRTQEKLSIPIESFNTNTDLNVLLKRAFLMYVENLEMDNSLKWVPFNKRTQ